MWHCVHCTTEVVNANISLDFCIKYREKVIQGSLLYMCDDISIEEVTDIAHDRRQWSKGIGLVIFRMKKIEIYRHHDTIL